MDEERYLILKMLEEGKITAEEASALLSALDESGRAEGKGSSDQAGGGPGSAESEGPRDSRPGHRDRERRRDHCCGPRRRRFDWDALDEGWEELRRDLEKVRLGAIEIGDEVSRRVQEAIRRSEWHRGGPRPFRHFVRSFGDVFSVPFGREMHEDTFEKDITVPAGARVAVRGLSGDVRVEAWDEDKVKVLARKRVWAGSRDEARQRATDYRILLELEGNDVFVGAELTEDAPGWLPARCTIDYDVRVPAGSRLKVGVTNGDVIVAGVKGGVELRSTNGEVRARDVAGEILVTSTNGDVVLQAAEAGELTVKTVNGDISLDLTAVRPGQHVIGTARGDVVVAVPEDLRLDLQASTMHGDINLDLPGKVVSRTSTRLEAHLGEGVRAPGEPGAGGPAGAGAEQAPGGTTSAATPRLDIRTLFGDVTLKARKEG